jgi:geranylgeranyl diphosphate synthase type I
MVEILKRARKLDERVLSYLEGGEPDKLVSAVRHYPEAGGKRLRPVLAMVVADAISGDEERVIPFACSLEIIHNFTLIHDDVMDDDQIRRGRPAVHALYDMPTAIIAGDALFARAFEVLARTDVPHGRFRGLLDMVAHTVWEIAEGQQLDIDFESSDEVTIDQYLRMIEKKTAVLFACAAKGAVTVSDGTEAQEREMWKYGILLGLGFQIWDDVLGITAEEEKLGKPVGSDIRNGKRTLIVLHALENADEERRKMLLSILGRQDATDEEVNRAIQTLEEVGSIEFATNKALDYASRGIECLECLEDSTSKELLRADKLLGQSRALISTRCLPGRS